MSFWRIYRVLLIVFTQLFAYVDESFDNLGSSVLQNVNATSKEYEVVEFDRVTGKYQGHFSDYHAEAGKLIKKRSLINLSEWKPGKALCSPFDSCLDRCGQPYTELPFTCSCDYSCVFYSDCCVDYETQCGIQAKESILLSTMKSKAFPSCVQINNKSSPAYIINKCSPSWATSDAEVSKFLTTYPHLCFESIYSMLGQGTEQCNEVCINLCYNNIREECASEGTLDPVRDSGGYVYAKASCAVCNWQPVYRQINPGMMLSSKYSKDEGRTNNLTLGNVAELLSYSLRKCSPYIHSCSSTSSRIDDQILGKLCQQYSGPVNKYLPEGKRNEVMYKNVYCALCNGEDLSSLNCDTGIEEEALINEDIIGDHVVVSDFDTLNIHNTKLFTIPAAFSLLLNFGLDGGQRPMMTSVEENEMALHQKQCGSTHIWDPFGKLCRKLYCSTEFILIDFQCVRKPTNPTGPTDEEEKEDTSDIGNVVSKYVHLSLTVKIVLFDVLSFYGQDENFTEVFKNSLAEECGINASRIQNMKFILSLGNITDFKEIRTVLPDIAEDQPIIFTIDFDLHESDYENNVTEPTVKSIVNKLYSSVSSSDEGLYLNQTKSRISQVHQTTISSWCSAESGGIQKVYWNSDVTFITSNTGNLFENETIISVYVNKTKKLYTKGQFYASILYQRFNFRDKLVNVSKLVVVCDQQTKLNETCPRIRLEKYEYEILPNGSLRIINCTTDRDEFYIDSYELAENDSVLVCLKPSDFSGDNTPDDLQFDTIQAYVSLVLMCVSAFALTLVLLTYVIFPCLRNLPGCNTLNLTLSLLAMQITFLLGQRRTVDGVWCKIAALMLHYEILCSFMWMNVMAYDLYKTFGTNSVLATIRSKKKYLLRYMIYCYGSPIVIVAICLLLDKYGQDIVIAPLYGHGGACWMSKYGSGVFFASPLAAIMVVNIIFYLKTIFTIRKVKNTIHESGKTTCQNGWKDVILYARMAFVIGLTWALAFIAAYVPRDRVVGEAITYLFIIFNTLQGVFIFFVFVCNRRVFKLYAGLVKNICRLPVALSTKDSMAKLSRGIDRSVSSNTVVSTISVSLDSDQEDGNRNLNSVEEASECENHVT